MQTFFFTFGAVLKANNLRFIAKMFRSLLFNALAFSRDISLILACTLHCEIKGLLESFENAGVRN